MQNVNEFDFSIWEERYGRPLTDEEKQDIGRRMSGFFRILIEQDLKEKKLEGLKKLAELEKDAWFYDVKI